MGATGCGANRGTGTRTHRSKYNRLTANGSTTAAPLFPLPNVVFFPGDVAAPQRV